MDGYQERSKEQEGEKGRDEWRTEKQNWTKMSLTAYGKQGGYWGDRDKVEARDWETANSGKLT